MKTMKEQLPAGRIQWHGLTLTRYSDQAMHRRGRTWYTYAVDADDEDTRLWEHCPATGETVQAQE